MDTVVDDCDCKVLDKKYQIRFATERNGVQGYICDFDTFHSWDFYDK